MRPNCDNLFVLYPDLLEETASKLVSLFLVNGLPGVGNVSEELCKFIKGLTLFLNWRKGIKLPADGISILGWNPPKTMGDFILVVVSGLVSLAILFVWWCIFHRWIYLQGIYSYRAREIEEKLNLWFNRYARLIEHWESEEAESLGKSELREKDRAAYDKLQQFRDKQVKKHFVHFTIRNALRALTIILAIGWLLFMALYGIAYF